MRGEVMLGGKRDSRAQVSQLDVFQGLLPSCLQSDKTRGPAHPQSLTLVVLPPLPLLLLLYQEEEPLSQKPLLPEDIGNPKDPGRPESTELHRGQY